VFTAARRYNLTEVVDQITTPLLITDPEGEQFGLVNHSSCSTDSPALSDGPLHCSRGRRPALRANGQIPSRTEHVPLARRDPPSRDELKMITSSPDQPALGYASERKVSRSRNRSMSSAI
jgi:hypothetical protein